MHSSVWSGTLTQLNNNKFGHSHKQCNDLVISWQCGKMSLRANIGVRLLNADKKQAILKEIKISQ